MMRISTAAAVLTLMTCSAAYGQSQALRLRADAIGQARTPTGVLSLEGRGDPTDWASVEALLWGGTGELGEEIDLLVGRLVLRHPSHRAEVHLGRMVVGPGALRPVHIDGANTVFRLPWHMTIEGFGGWAVAPRFGGREYDWLVGGRIAQSIPGWLTVGAAYLQRRDAGRLGDHEVGADVSLSPFESVDLVARAAYDLTNPGISEAIATLSIRFADAWRLEAYGSHRSPSRILPATSLFSVLGDVPAQNLATRVRWRAAPRLDVIVDGGVRTFDEQLGEHGRLRVVLRLDDLGTSVLSGQLTRFGGPEDVAFIGARVALRLRLSRAWTVSAEAELVRPDQSDPMGEGDSVVQTFESLAPAPSRGEWWPWGLLAVDFRPNDEWIIAVALEGSATAELEAALDGLVRITWLWGEQ